ncbi:MAG: UDP-N-acetylglucosamine 4,6-dehydratase (inverting) [Thermoanaerobaculia bacterium]
MSDNPPSPFDWTSKSVLVTGGTGSFGKKFVAAMVANFHPKKLIVFSRDELKQHEMRQAFPDPEGSPMRYFIGDVRDVDRLRRAMNGVDVVVHTAAMKQVPACEYNPIEAVMTNINGAKNVIDAALDMGVDRVMALSTDKAVNPVNLYGATKLVAEKLFIQANAYRGMGPTKFSCVRYGNVVGSRGSVIPLFLAQRQNGRVTVTDPRMTRFWITLHQGVQFVIRGIESMQGGEVLVPKIPSAQIMHLVRAAVPECEVDVIGIRAGEKLHEVLVSEDEARSAVELEHMYIIKPAPLLDFRQIWPVGSSLPDGFRYSSDRNPISLSIEEIKEMVEGFRGVIG